LVVELLTWADPSGNIHNRTEGARHRREDSIEVLDQKGKQMIVEKGFPRRSRIIWGRGPYPRGRLRLLKETLANIAALVGLILMSETVTADQTTKTSAQLAIDQFDECAESLFKDEFGPAEVDYELGLNKEAVLFLSAKWISHDGAINILTRIRSIGSTVIREMTMTQNGESNRTSCAPQS
jgi:hypothetical protein